MTEASAWVSALPKTEMHLHLEGAVRPETMRRLSFNRAGWEGELSPGWQNAYYTFTDFAGFMRQLTPRVPCRPDEYALVARECFEDLASQGVIYAEVSFGPPVAAVDDDGRFWSVVEALEEERRAAERTLDLEVRLIAGLMRSLPPDVAEYCVNLSARARDRGVAIVGIDLHGDEARYPPAPFAHAFRLARDLGLGLRAHAGEVGPPGNVWESINGLGAQRLGHGLAAQDDDRLIERLRSGDITLDMCPTSNVRTGLVPSIKEHPIAAFLREGIPVTVNADDPLPFFTSTDREYRLLVEELGFGRADLTVLLVNAARSSFLEPRRRRELEEQLRTAWSAGDS